MPELSSLILIVDDNPTNLKVLFNVLKEAGFRTFVAKSGEDALAQLELITPDLILMDVMMPGISGFETCKRIKANPKTQDIPVIFLTALSETEDKVTGLTIGAVDYITKPLHHNEVLVRVRVHLQLRHLTRTVEAQAAALQQANQELQRLVNLDGLTQVANRRRFDECLQQEWKRLLREQQPLSLILCDVDYFKTYNDAYGHLAGDDCLKQIAQALQQSIQRPPDLAARYGGEEFALILPNTQLSGAIHIAKQIQVMVQNLNIPHRASDVGDRVTLSLGISTQVPSQESSIARLIEEADQALYRAKEHGRNTYCTY